MKNAMKWGGGEGTAARTVSDFNQGEYHACTHYMCIP